MPASNPSLPDGVYTAALTPLRADLRIDLPRAAEHARRLLDQGCDGLVLMGTTGEATAFSVAERQGLLEGMLEAGLPAHRLLVGTGCCALTDTVTLTAHAARLGAGGVLLVPPFYYKNPSEDGLFAAFDQVIQRVGAAGLHVYLYHIPAVTAVPIGFRLIERLAAAYPGTVVGVKDSSGDGDHTERLCRAFPGLRIFAGNETLLLRSLRAGSAGCISGTANVTAPVMADLYRRRDAPDADALQERLTALCDAIIRHPVIPTLKALIARQTGIDAWRTVAPPLRPGGPGTADAVAGALEALGFTMDAIAR
jgi:4-hydroxy-tetrahydrodipicolinate synthase